MDQAAGVFPAGLGVDRTGRAAPADGGEVRRGHIVLGGGQELPRRRQPLTPRAEQRLHLGIRRRYPQRPVVRPRGPVVLINHLLNDMPGQRMDVALVTDDKEVEEMRQSPCLLLHRQPRPAQLPALVGQEPVSVTGPAGPHRPAGEPDEPEDRRDR